MRLGGLKSKTSIDETLVQQGKDHYFEAMVVAAGSDNSESANEEPLGSEDDATGSDDVQLGSDDPETTSDTLDEPTTDPTTSTSDDAFNPDEDDTGLIPEKSTQSRSDTLGSGFTRRKSRLKSSDSTASDTSDDEYGTVRTLQCPESDETGDRECGSGGMGKGNQDSGEEEYLSEGRDDDESGDVEESIQYDSERVYDDEELIEEPTEEY